jgi:hypothetical protein
MNDEKIERGSKWFVVVNKPWNTVFKTGDVVKIEKIENDEVYFTKVANIQESRCDQTWIGYKQEWYDSMTQFR